MTEEFGGIHYQERRILPDRRSSNWRRATDHWRTPRERQMLDLLTELNAILSDWDAELQLADLADPHGGHWTDRVILDKERLAAAVEKYVQTRAAASEGTSQ